MSITPRWTAPPKTPGRPQVVLRNETVYGRTTFAHRVKGGWRWYCRWPGLAEHTGEEKTLLDAVKAAEAAGRCRPRAVDQSVVSKLLGQAQAGNLAAMNARDLTDAMQELLAGRLRSERNLVESDVQGWVVGGRIRERARIERLGPMKPPAGWTFDGQLWQRSRSAVFRSSALGCWVWLTVPERGQDRKGVVDTRREGIAAAEAEMRALGMIEAVQ